MHMNIYLNVCMYMCTCVYTYMHVRFCILTCTYVYVIGKRVMCIPFSGWFHATFTRT